MTNDTFYFINSKGNNVGGIRKRLGKQREFVIDYLSREGNKKEIKEKNKTTNVSLWVYTTLAIFIYASNDHVLAFGHLSVRRLT